MLLAICQGLGLAIAVGLIIGVVVPPIMPAWGAVAGAAPLGVLAAGAALNGADEALWPALPVGVIGAGLAAIVVLAAVVVAGVSLVLKPFSLLVLVALLWVWVSRRRQAERKHEGLR